MSLRPLYLLLIVLVATAGTVACGQKGPLYLPDQPATEPRK